MPKELPYMKWYPSDFEEDEDVKLMTLEEVGFYVRCMNHAWSNNGLPNSLELIGRIFKIANPEEVSRLWLAVGKKFELAEAKRLHAIPLHKPSRITNALRWMRLKQAGGRIAEATRLIIFNRDGNKCLRCRTSFRLTIDHIVPVAKGGTNAEENLQTLCKSCNCSKRDREEPAYARVPLLY